MAFTFNDPPTTDRDDVRLAIGDVTENDGPAPDRANLADELIDRWLEVGGDVWGAAALAADHLSALWISRPIFGPGELSTVHTNLTTHWAKRAEEFRKRAADPDVSGAVVRVGSFTRTDGYSDNGSEYT